MNLSRSALRAWCAIVPALFTLCASSARAIGPLPTATEIARGDILLYEIDKGWIKIDPTTKQLFQLTWTADGAGSLAFDADGAIIGLAPGGGDGQFVRINPVTGTSTSFGPATFPAAVDFDIALNGDLILADPADNARKLNGVWSVEGNGALHRYSRQTGQYSIVSQPEFFSSRAVEIGPSGETYIGEFFRGLQTVDLLTGDLGPAGGYADSFITDLAIYPDGDLAVLTTFQGIHRIDPMTGEDIQLIPGGIIGPDHLAVDALGNIWTISAFAVSLIDAQTNTRTVIAEQTFPLSTGVFLPVAIAVVPEDWTPPPVPEPATFALASIGLALFGRRKGVRRKRCQERMAPSEERIIFLGADLRLTLRDDAW